MERERSRAPMQERSLSRSNSFQSPLYSMPPVMLGVGVGERHTYAPPSSQLYNGPSVGSDYYCDRDNDGAVLVRSTSTQSLDSPARNGEWIPPSSLLSNEPYSREPRSEVGGLNEPFPPNHNSHQERYRHNEGPVDFVHHDSPYGPAISVYPTRNRHPKPSLLTSNDRSIMGSSNHGPPPTRTESSSPLFRAEQEKLSEYNSNHSRISNWSNHSHHSHDHHHNPNQNLRQHSFHQEPSSRSLLSNGSRGAFRPVAVVTPPPPAEQQHRMIEIAPGCSLRLRGAAETQEAIRRDEIISSLCFACELEPLFCIHDAEYVLCPQCRVVNPLPDDRSSRRNPELYLDGVALGFTLETLESIQRDLLFQNSHPYHSSSSSRGGRRPLRHSGGRISGWR